MIDFVIVSYNTLDLLQALYQQIKDMHGDEHLVIVDNGSEDGTQEWLRRLRWQTVIQNEDNRGWAPACNQGAAEGEAPLVCFLNTDVTLTDGWLDGVWAEFAEDDDVVVVTPEQVDAEGATYNHTYPSGACMVVERWWFEDVGGFDDALVFGHDDHDIARRVQEDGKRWAKSEPAVVHIGGASRAADTNALVEAGREHMAAKWSEVSLRWKAGHDPVTREARGRTLIGVPARNLTRAEVLEIQARHGYSRDDLIASGLYAVVAEAESESED